MVKKMSLLIVALVALTITLEMRSTIARVQQYQVAATTNDVAHQSIPVIAASKNAVINPQMFPVLEAAPTDVVNPQDVNQAIPSGPRPQGAKEVIIPQRCLCCEWSYSKYFVNCSKICCV